MFSGSVSAAPAAEEAAEPVLIEDAELLEGVSEVYKSDDGSYTVMTSARGFESDVCLSVGLDSSGAVTVIKTIENNETGDNGSQALGENYLALYKGGSSFSLFDISIPGVFLTKIDTLSGATDSCYGVFYLVDAATEQFAALN